MPGRAARIFLILRDINQAIYIPGQSTVANVNQRRPLFPYFSRFSFIESVTNSSYNSLQASLDKRFSRGVTVLDVVHVFQIVERSEHAF